MDDIFATTTVKARTLWGIINAKITSIISMDRKAKFQIGSDQNKNTVFGVLQSKIATQLIMRICLKSKQSYVHSLLLH